MFAFAGYLYIWQKLFKEVAAFGITHNGLTCILQHYFNWLRRNAYIFTSAALAQAVQAMTINVEPMCTTLGNMFEVLSSKLAKLSILFISGAA